MVKLKINNTDYEVADGLTILDVARSIGLAIPTLCHSDGLPHYTSCMACLVKDIRNGNFLASCSAIVQDGMEIDSSSEEVILIRRKAIELLMSEHRAECEAPCRVVCPAGYNIPVMNRFLIANDIESAVELSFAQIQTGPFKCIDCPGYCENACRRKKIDLPVSIRNLQIFIFQQINREIPTFNTGKTPAKKSNRFTSRIGRLEESELQVWLKECPNDTVRVREIHDLDSAAAESESCMHCDCRALDNCRLRDLADKFSIKDPRGKLVNASIQKKINVNTGLIFENAKCIKCGLCVRLCEDSKDEPALCFINRGFVSIISEPLTEDFNNILKSKTKEVIEICPTGALSNFMPPVPLARDIPLKGELPGDVTQLTPL